MHSADYGTNVRGGSDPVPIVIAVRIGNPRETETLVGFLNRKVPSPSKLIYNLTVFNFPKIQFCVCVGIAARLRHNPGAHVTDWRRVTRRRREDEVCAKGGR